MADYPIIDSHIHLYPSSEVDSLAWATPENPIAAQRSVDEYRAATGNPSNLKGFIFLETDRKHDLASGAADGSGWEGPLAEVAWLRRIVEGTPREGEGHSAADASLCLGIVPWAPLPSGPEVLDRYLDRVQEVAGPVAWPKIRGPPDAIFEALFAWLGIVLATFGPRRTMFASDWPVCTVRDGAAVDDASWRKWKLLVERMCYMATMDPEDQAELFAGTALRAYGIELSKDA
ncbi:L-rhamnono-gamma-lactonase like protein [Verticillium longisporum]|uniref:L-rhamnono-gamma-lactonase like protein n=1 Tax=Verticillium longisporum TaxID=100787 RepID=A0A8I2ZM76_VERLO|nr:L-rhamnono-gamma-lactonase like protein [Verticillium longisporum]